MVIERKDVQAKGIDNIFKKWKQKTFSILKIIQSFGAQEGYRTPSSQDQRDTSRNIVSKKNKHLEQQQRRILKGTIEKR
jgi:hypothetical protein